MSISVGAKWYPWTSTYNTLIRMILMFRKGWGGGGGFWGIYENIGVGQGHTTSALWLQIVAMSKLIPQYNVFVLPEMRTHILTLHTLHATYFIFFYRWGEHKTYACHTDIHMTYAWHTHDIRHVHGKGALNWPYCSKDDHWWKGSSGEIHLTWIQRVIFKKTIF